MLHEDQSFRKFVALDQVDFKIVSCCQDSSASYGSSLVGVGVANDIVIDVVVVVAIVFSRQDSVGV